MSDRSVVRRLSHTFGPYLWAQRRALASSYSFRLVDIGLALLAPWPLKVLIDYVLIAQPLPPVLGPWLQPLSTGMLIAVLALAIVGIAALRAVADSLQKIIGARMRERLNLELRDRMLTHLQTLPPTVRTSHRSGELVLRLVGDVDLFSRVQTKILPTAFEAAVTLAATLATMFWIAPRVAWLSLVLLPFFAVLVRHYGRQLSAASRVKRREEGEVAGLAQEIVRSLPALQALGGETLARKRFSALNARSLTAGVRETAVTVALEQTLRIAHGIAVAIVIGFGATEVVRGAMTVGELTVLAAYVVQLLKPIERLNDLAETASRGMAAGERLIALLDLQPAVRDAKNPIRIRRATGVIEMRDVWFRYPSLDGRHRDVLRGASMRLEPGRLTVLLGASGAGKSTLLALLPRLFDPSRGVILLDGTPLQDLSLQSLRAQIAPMAQETHLFAGSIREALSPDGTSYDDGRYWEALRRVDLATFVEGLPQQLDTPLGEDGVNVSGGQRQRLSLARAFVLDRPILLLDEPLAHVDAHSAALITSVLRQLKAHRTCLAVTHRLSLLEHADVVYRLADGVVADVTSRPPRRVRAEGVTR